jgi:hypothetical protein
VVGPSFDLVSGWAEQGIPLKVAIEGIDRYFERYYRKGPRRRPVKVDFCEADVLDAFDQWRRAVGAVSVGTVSHPQSPSLSLPAHLERVVRRLTSARVSGNLGAAFDTLIDRVSAELDQARAKSGGLRGEARRGAIARLDMLDAELVAIARAGMDAPTLARLSKEADDELAPFREGMAPELFAQARAAALDRAIRTRLSLPTIAFEDR